MHTRNVSLCIALLLGSCTDFHDAVSDGPDARALDIVDASPAVVNIDASSSIMDASALLDAQPGDSEVDAGRRDAESDYEHLASCGFDFVVSVQCRELVCTGATPVCCEHWMGLAPVPAQCVASVAECARLDQHTYMFTMTVCDDANDCPLGTVCMDGWNKALSHRNGASCAPARAYPQYGYQLCSSDCECRPEDKCIAGRCPRAMPAPVVP